MIVATGPTQTDLSPTLACGIKQVITLGEQVGIIGPPTCGTGGVPGVTIGQAVISDTRAAGGKDRSSLAKLGYCFLYSGRN